MGFVVLAVGALLSVVGAYEIYYGNGVIAVERGWSAFIGGSVLFAGGIVTAALGLAIHVLLDLRRLLAPVAALPVAPAATAIDHDATFAAPHAQDALAVPFDAAASEPAAVADPRAVPQLEARPIDLPAPHALAPMAPLEAHRDGADEHLADRPAPRRAEPDVHATSPAVEAHDEHHQEPPREEPAHDEPAAPPTAPALPHADAAFSETAAHDAIAAAPPAAPPHDDEPAAVSTDAVTVAAREATDAPVIGRYESEGTSYVMYADGSIDAQSSAGVYRFASMAELKRFIEG